LHQITDLNQGKADLGRQISTKRPKAKVPGGVPIRLHAAYFFENPPNCDAHHLDVPEIPLPCHLSTKVEESEAMIDRYFALATVAAATVQAGVAFVFFGTLTLIVLSSFSVIAVPY